MKTLTIEAYEYNELSDEAKAVALKNHQERCDRSSYVPWKDEIFESLKSVVEWADFKLMDWSIGPYSNSYIKVRHNNNEACEEFSGRRAFAYMENHFFGPLRLRWHGAKRWAMAKHNAAYRSCHAPSSTVRQCYCAGRVPPCPLTGVCFDEDFIDALMKDLREGATLKDAIEWLSNKAVELMEAECESQRSEEYFIEECSANAIVFDENGNIIDTTNHEEM